MNKEEKQLLLQDLSSRLSYGVICHTEKGDGHLCSINQTIFGNEYGINIKATERDYFNDREEVIKPYLRSMSSITEEEHKELLEKVQKDWSIDIDKLGDLYFDIGDACYPDIDLFLDIIDWLNKHHFDYRGLIKKGLAIAVTEENNPYKD